MIKPTALKSKDRVALLAPASRPAKPSALKRAEKIIDEMGFTPVIGAHALDTYGAMAGDDRSRLHDLVWALEDDSVAAIWCLNGGYGSLRLLRDIPYQTFANKPKIVIGSDDNSHLLFALNQKSQVVTFHGSNLDRIDSKESFDRYKKLLSSHDHYPAMHVKDRFLSDFCYAPVHAVGKGRMVAGNLTALVSLFGTDFEPDLSGAVLLLEDRAERNDILDRWFTTLYISNKLSTVAALGLGQFEDCSTKGSFNMLSFEELVSDRVSEMKLATCFNLPFGQACENALVPLGLQVSFDTAKGHLTYLESALVRD
ncbi:MAG: LD-carboxypeptidase [Candidatus Melainabacteria bacterium]|nr:LD-carboxypeptidase [Candidatus Melainabacteria bacterium]